MAPKALSLALKKADNSGADVIVMARGGGSREDLWCFNDEALAREIFITKTPIISAIGHEIDYVISDFVADLRAPTPTAAMTTLLPDMGELMQTIDAMSFELKKLANAHFERKFNALTLLKVQFNKNSLEAKIKNQEQILANFRQNLQNKIVTNLLKFENNLKLLRQNFKSREQFLAQIKDLIRIQKDGKTISLDRLISGDEVVLSSLNTSKNAKIM